MFTSSPRRSLTRLLPLGVLVAACLVCASATHAGAKTSSTKSAPPPRRSAPARPASNGRPANGTGASGSRIGTPGSHLATGGAGHPVVTTGGSHSGGVTTGGAGRAIGTREPVTTGGVGDRGGARQPVSTNRVGVPRNSEPGRSGPFAGHTPESSAGRGMVHPVPPRPLTVSRTPYGSVSRDSRGRLRDVHDERRGIDVHHGLNGSRRVSAIRPDHSRIMAERGRAGYIARPYGFRGHPYYSRTYAWHGHVYQRMYRGYAFRGVAVEVYAPRVYYAPAFYGWAYYPWAAPVPYAWGWGADPWYGAYGFYFAPYPSYAAPADWLTDYVISQNLAAAYAAQQAQQTGVSYPQPAGQPVLTPEIKAQIAAEVKAQIQLENAEAQANAQGQEPDPESSSINRMFADGQTHVFIADDSLDVTDYQGNECPLTDGDVLQLAPPQDPSAQAGSLTVLASKGGKECPQGATVSVAFNDLQEMQNGMRANLDQGMQELSQARDTPRPPMDSSATSPSEIAAAAPKPDANVDAELRKELTEADEADRAAASAPAQPNPTSMLRAPFGWNPGSAPPARAVEPAELSAAKIRIQPADSIRW
jgi:hypothetical protein